MNWWTLSQRIRTIAELILQVDLQESEEPPKYQQIAEKALPLNQSDFSSQAIARLLGVDGETVMKAPRWMMH